MKIQHEGSRRKGSHRDGWIPFFQPPQSITTHEEPGGHVGRGDGTLASRQCDVTPEFTKGVCGGERH